MFVTHYCRDKFAAKVQLFFYIRKFFTGKSIFCNLYFAKCKKSATFCNFLRELLVYLKIFAYLCTDFITLCKYKTFTVLFFFTSQKFNCC